MGNRILLTDRQTDGKTDGQTDGDTVLVGVCPATSRSYTVMGNRILFTDRQTDGQMVILSWWGSALRHRVHIL